jgi:hypothetical protein
VTRQPAQPKDSSSVSAGARPALEKGTASSDCNTKNASAAITPSATVMLGGGASVGSSKKGSRSSSFCQTAKASRADSATCTILVQIEGA